MNFSRNLIKRLSIQFHQIDEIDFDPLKEIEEVEFDVQFALHIGEVATTSIKMV